MKQIHFFSVCFTFTFPLFNLSLVSKSITLTFSVRWNIDELLCCSALEKKNSNIELEVTETHSVFSAARQNTDFHL